MAYVPDDAMRRKRQISHSAWDVYEQLCAWGDPDTGIVEGRYVWNKRLVEETGLKLGTVKNAMTELRRDGWIEERKGRIFLLVGTFMKEVRRLQREAKPAAEAARKASPHSDAPSPVGDALSPVNDRPSLVNDAPSPHSDAPSPVGDDHGNRGSRARSDQTTNQPSDQTGNQTHTHQTGPTRPAGEAAGASGVCVCKAKHGSEFCDEVRLAYGRNDPTIRNPKGYAQSPAVQSGRDDGLIREWLGKVKNPSAITHVRDASACPDCHGTGMWYPQGRDKGVKKCRHERLIDAADTSPPEPVRAVAGSP